MEKLLKLLNENARYTNEELAVMLEVDAVTVAKEIDRLESTGVICGYKPLFNWELASPEKVSALIELKVIPQAYAGFDDIAEKIMKFDEVASVYLMSGSYDLAVQVVGRTFQEVAMFVAKTLATMEPIQSTATHFVLRRYKDMGVDLIVEKKDDRGNISL
ncbi:hypothetical protein SDC9_149247 [bioreactor metagenome]|uniref:Transcription regulator AsnC/Lrp ligand binding domain-containing protein n=1 Tax=bioreactor metagenome TaxID=1076179 RepID=A0A645EN08_9ZZZZ